MGCGAEQSCKAGTILKSGPDEKNASQLTGLIQLLSIPSATRLTGGDKPGQAPHHSCSSLSSPLFPGQSFLGLSGGEHRNKLSFKSCLMPYYLDLCFLNLRTVVSLWDGLLWIIPS